MDSLAHEVLHGRLDLCNVALTVNALADNDPQLFHTLALAIGDSGLCPLNGLLDVKAV